MVGNMRTFVTDRQTDRRTYRLTEVVSWLPRDSKKILVQERMHIQVAQLIGKWGDFKSSDEDAKNVSKCVKNKLFSATSRKSILAKILEKFWKIGWYMFRNENFGESTKKFTSGVSISKNCIFYGGDRPPPQKLWISSEGGICQIFHLHGGIPPSPTVKNSVKVPLKSQLSW